MFSWARTARSWRFKSSPRHLKVGQASSLSLLSGEMPYTPNFDRIVAKYNEEMNTSETPHDVWRLLEKVLKVGEEKIDAFLRRTRALAVA